MFRFVVAVGGKAFGESDLRNFKDNLNRLFSPWEFSPRVVRRRVPADPLRQTAEYSHLFPHAYSNPARSRTATPGIAREKTHYGAGKGFPKLPGVTSQTVHSLTARLSPEHRFAPAPVFPSSILIRWAASPIPVPMPITTATPISPSLIIPHCGPRTSWQIGAVAKAAYPIWRHTIQFAPGSEWRSTLRSFNSWRPTERG